MNKYALFITILLLMVVMMLVADSISLSYLGGLPDAVLVDENVNAITVFGMFKTFWKLLTFSLAGIPAWFSVIAVYIPSLTLTFMFLSFIRGVE